MSLALRAPIRPRPIIAARAGRYVFAEPAAIRTSYWRKPGPTDRFDWSATLDDYDGAPDAGGPCACIGYGATEAEAITDLREQIEEMA